MDMASAGNLEENRMHLTLSSKALFILSATSFCYGFFEHLSTNDEGNDKEDVRNLKHIYPWNKFLRREYSSGGRPKAKNGAPGLMGGGNRSDAQPERSNATPGISFGVIRSSMHDVRIMAITLPDSDWGV